MLGDHAQFVTGGCSTEAGITELLTRMATDRFKISARRVEWREEFEGYHRKDGLIVKTDDDLLSATRIGVMQICSAKPVGLGARGSRGASGNYRGWAGEDRLDRQIARAIDDWDIFTGRSYGE